MSQFQQLDQLMERQDGMLRNRAGPRGRDLKTCFLSIRAVSWTGTGGHGIYLSKDAWVDAMYLLHLRCPQAVFSHETALFFHDLTDREPLRYSITVKTGYNPTRLKDEGVQVFTIKAELHEDGLTTAQTPFGHDVPVYDMERTICDVLRSRSHIEMQTFQDALKAYARRKDKTCGRWCAMPNCSGSRRFYASIWRYCYDKDSQAAERFDPQPVKEKRCGRADFDAQLYDGAFFWNAFLSRPTGTNSSSRAG